MGCQCLGNIVVAELGFFLYPSSNPSTLFTSSNKKKKAMKGTDFKHPSKKTVCLECTNRLHFPELGYRDEFT